jgi:hypothetical protein
VGGEVISSNEGSPFCDKIAIERVFSGGKALDYILKPEMLFSLFEKMTKRGALTSYRMMIVEKGRFSI